MRLVHETLAFLLIPAILSACVTTREQFNQEHGIVEDGAAQPLEKPKSIKVEELPAEKPVTKSEPLSAPTPTIAPSATPAVTASATPVVAQPSATPVAAPSVSPVLQPPAGPLVQASPSVTPAPTAIATPAAIQVPYAIPSVTPTPTPILNPDTANYGVDELRAELARVAGMAEELKHEKDLKDKAGLEEQKKAQERIAALEKQLKDLTPDTPKLPEGKSPFEAGKDAYSANNYEESILYFTQVLSASETGKEAEEATYLRGESYFKKQQYNKAIVDYSRFSEKYQKSSFHPKALLRIAESFEAMGRRDDAKAFYAELMEKFPKTAEGKLAKKRTK
jgi:TolA-binding protein